MVVADSDQSTAFLRRRPQPTIVTVLDGLLLGMLLPLPRTTIVAPAVSRIVTAAPNPVRLIRY